MNIAHIFSLARNISKHSIYKYKLGAVLVKNGNIISVGFNKIKFNSKYSFPMKETIHAEMACLKTSGKDYLKNAIVFVYREDSRGNPALAKPCYNCLSRLKKFGVKRIYYSTGEYPFFEMENI